jgi:hypothetical protein
MRRPHNGNQLYIFQMLFRPAWSKPRLSTRGSILEEYFRSTCASENSFSEGTE